MAVTGGPLCWVCTSMLSTDSPFSISCHLRPSLPSPPIPHPSLAPHPTHNHTPTILPPAPIPAAHLSSSLATYMCTMYLCSSCVHSW
jgi:hypothetical protein